MKKITTLIFIVPVLFFSACKKNNTPETILNEMTDTTAVLKYSGVLASGPYGTVNGEAKIFKTGTKYELKLMDFSGSNAQTYGFI